MIFGTIEKWNMVVSKFFKPVNLAGVFEETQSNRVYGRVAPSLVEEAAGSVQMVEVVVVSLRSEPI